jgi:uncharacterized protein
VAVAGASAAAEVSEVVDRADPGRRVFKERNKKEMDRRKRRETSRIAGKNILLAVLVFYGTVGSAQKQVPGLWGTRVHDEATVLSQTTIDGLEHRLKAFQDSTSNQVAILIVSSLDGDPIEDFSHRVAEKWGLGTKEKDNGVLLLVVVDDHQVRIEVGKGLEGALTDEQCNHIIRNQLAPAFRRGNYDQGVNDAVNAIMATIKGEYKADAAGVKNDGMSTKDRIFIGLFVFFILGLFTLLSLFSAGGTGWGLYFFLIPFYAVFPWIVLGLSGGLTLLGIYVVATPILKMVINRSAWGKSKIMKWQSVRGSGQGWSSGRGWGGSGSSSFGGGGFSGGGGSFGGGGCSGSW